MTILGLVAIVGYGSWYYSFGVLLVPISEDTGWNESLLTSSFSAGSIGIGLGSLYVGRVLDHHGARPVLLVGGIVSGTLLLAASVAQHALAFVGLTGLALTAIGSSGFYHVTMTAAARSRPQSPARAIGIITIFGAFASVIFVPLTGELLAAFHWRTVTRILGFVTTATFVAAAALTNSGPQQSVGRRPRQFRRLVEDAASTPQTRALMLAVFFGGIALSCTLLYQVPLMIEAGLPLQTAATIAGLRGLFQFVGRVPIDAAVSRLGSATALVVAFVLLALGGAFLTVSGSLVAAVAFAGLAGIGIGAFSPLQGIATQEHFHASDLGSAMGLNNSILMAAGAAGPAIAGLTLALANARRPIAVVISVAASIAAVASHRTRVH